MAERRLRVMMSVPAIRPTTNPYIAQLVHHLRRVSDLRLFSWRGALWGRYDVFHVHWPEVLMRGRSPLRTWVRRGATWLLLVRFSLTRTIVVRTLHNVEPHEGAKPVERVLLRMWDARTSVWIALSDHSPPPPHGSQTTVLHGHYRDVYAHAERNAPEPGVVGVVGLIRPYKGTDELIETILQDAGPADFRLHVAGSPSDEVMAQRLVALAGASPRIALELGYLDDVRIVEVVTSSSLVALPYRRMLNSGMALLALSLDRPILVPDTPTNRSLQAEVGAGWVHLFTGRVRAEDIRDALAGGIPTGRPRLNAREWDAAAERHLDAYMNAVAGRGNRS